jgi:hypothetical protein
MNNTAKRLGSLLCIFVVFFAVLLLDSKPSGAADWLSTQGNRIYRNGEIWMGRGANLHDTRSCNACTWSPPNVQEVKRRIDELVDVWGANFIRLDLESYSSAGGRNHWQSFLTDTQYLSDIKEIVAYIGTKSDTYVLISLWIDPSFSDQGLPTTSTVTAWKFLAAQFTNVPQVMFGIVNEPQYNFDGSDNQDRWEAFNTAVAAIRDAEKNNGSQSHVITVQGLGGWSRFLTYYLNHPITAGDGKNIAYEVHVYDDQSLFDDRFVTPSQTLPVIIGEFGPAQGYMNMNDCEELMKQADQLNIPYLAWTFHMRCPPNLLVDNSGGKCGVDMELIPTEWGKLLKTHLGGSPLSPPPYPGTKANIVPIYKLLEQGE